jgi:RNA polymerase sigma-70 factor, ECF subfamily
MKMSPAEPIGAAPSRPGAVTELLSRIHAGEAQAWDALMPLICDDLHRLAAAYMREHTSGGILQPTALVNETYLGLLDQKGTEWKNRAHFFGVAALLMRRILVDEARRRAVWTRVEAQIARDTPGCVEPVDLCLLDDALNRLAAIDSRPADVVELRYFGGLTIEETAEFLGVSPKTVKRDWDFARTWLRAEMPRP